MEGEMNGRHILRKPMSAGEFFRKICSILKEKGSMPDILDYSMAVFESITGFMPFSPKKRENGKVL